MSHKAVCACRESCGAKVEDANSPATNRGKRYRPAQKLPAPLAPGTVDFEPVFALHGARVT